ncbi:hypothetical protein GGR40_001849 [Novosphingobium gossypii]
MNGFQAFLPHTRLTRQTIERGRMAFILPGRF